jgi:transglycosylase-like protein with SLT domain
MGSVDRVNSQNVGSATNAGGQQRLTRTISSGRGQFEEGLTGYSLYPDRSEGSRPSSQILDAARQRSIEELRTLARAVHLGERDPEQLADLIFFARHPDLLDLPPDAYDQELIDEWNNISALLVHPTLNAEDELVTSQIYAHERGVRGFDDVIARAVECCPGLSPAILKGLLAQESGFNPAIINRYGYAGIAQIGRDEAREVGLRVGIAGTWMDERLNPFKAIPAAARLLSVKAERLGETAFSRYGQPEGIEYWNFVLAAYDGGESTVTLAMGHAHRRGLALAREKGLVGMNAVDFARDYASKWDNLTAGGSSSPLGLAVSRFFPELASTKYAEISAYPRSVVAHTATSPLSLWQQDDRYTRGQR